MPQTEEVEVKIPAFRAVSVFDISQTDGENFEYKELRATLSPEQAEPEVTLTVAECGEFHNMGEFYENIPTVEEAVAIWKQIPPERMNGIPAIRRLWK